MKKLLPIMMSLCIAVSCAACSSSDVSPTPNVSETPAASGTPVPETVPQPEKIFSRVIGPSVWRREKLDAMPHYNPDSDESYQVDFRHRDVSGLDMTDALDDLLMADFDSKTVWPDTLPDGFDLDTIWEYGKDPGLGVRSLHESGITGKGTSIGIIDQALYQGHDEYADNLVCYEEIPELNFEAEMHGSAVSSLAVGKNCGVAPESHLYYIASSLRDGDRNLTYEYYAKALNRLLDINETLPEQEKMRVISISRGFSKNDLCYDEMMEAIARAKEEGVFVITTSSFNKEEYGFDFAGTGREPMGDPNDLSTYSVGSWQRSSVEMFYDDYKNSVFFPMDARAFASFADENGYEYKSSGGWSWVIPYIAGTYALCAQVYPEITPEIFFEYLKATADSITVDNLGKEFTIEYLANPVRLIAELQNLTD